MQVLGTAELRVRGLALGSSTRQSGATWLYAGSLSVVTALGQLGPSAPPLPADEGW